MMSSIENAEPDAPLHEARATRARARRGVLVAATVLLAGVVAGLWVARDRQPLSPLAQRFDPEVELPEGWDLPPPAAQEPASPGAHNQGLTRMMFFDARGVARTLRWEFRVELPVKESRCGSRAPAAALESCAEATDGADRVAAAVISNSRTVLDGLGGVLERARLFPVKGLPPDDRSGYFQFVRVKHDWVRVSFPGHDGPVIGVSITPPATSLRAISGRLLTTTELSPPALRSERVVARVRRWLDIESPLGVELVAVPQSWADRRVTRLGYFIHDAQLRLWVDANTGQPYHGYCVQCLKALNARVERLSKSNPGVFLPAEPDKP